MKSFKPFKHTPEPWSFSREHDKTRSRSFWWIESGTRKLMACLEVWDLNRDPKWRAAHPEVMKEHGETLVEVNANAQRIVDCVNGCAGLQNPAKNIPSLIKTVECAIRGLKDAEEAARRITKDIGTANMILEKIDWLQNSLDQLK